MATETGTSSASQVGEDTPPPALITPGFYEMFASMTRFVPRHRHHKTIASIIEDVMAQIAATPRHRATCAFIKDMKAKIDEALIEYMRPENAHLEYVSIPSIVPNFTYTVKVYDENTEKEAIHEYTLSELLLGEPMLGSEMVRDINTTKVNGTLAFERLQRYAKLKVLQFDQHLHKHGNLVLIFDGAEQIDMRIYARNPTRRDHPFSYVHDILTLAAHAEFAALQAQKLERPS